MHCTAAMWIQSGLKEELHSLIDIGLCESLLQTLLHVLPQRYQTLLTAKTGPDRNALL